MSEVRSITLGTADGLMGLRKSKPSPLNLRCGGSIGGGCCWSDRCCGVLLDEDDDEEEEGGSGLGIGVGRCRVRGGGSMRVAFAFGFGGGAARVQL